MKNGNKILNIQELGTGDIQKRVGLEPTKLVAKRIVEEISGGSRINIFVKK